MKVGPHERTSAPKFAGWAPSLQRRQSGIVLMSINPECYELELSTISAMAGHPLPEFI